MIFRRAFAIWYWYDFAHGRRWRWRMLIYALYSPACRYNLPPCFTGSLSRVVPFYCHPTSALAVSRPILRSKMRFTGIFLAVCRCLWPFLRISHTKYASSPFASHYYGRFIDGLCYPASLFLLFSRFIIFESLIIAIRAAMPGLILPSRRFHTKYHDIRLIAHLID